MDNTDWIDLRISWAFSYQKLNFIERPTTAMPAANSALTANGINSVDDLIEFVPHMDPGRAVATSKRLYNRPKYRIFDVSVVAGQNRPSAIAASTVELPIESHKGILTGKIRRSQGVSNLVDLHDVVPVPRLTAVPGAIRRAFLTVEEEIVSSGVVLGKNPEAVFHLVASQDFEEFYVLFDVN